MKKIQTGHLASSRLELATQLSREVKLPASPVLEKLTLCIPFSHQYKYPSFPQNMCNYSERKILREVSSKHPPNQRELLILREKSLQSFLIPSLIVIPIEIRFLSKHYLHPFRVLSVFGALGSIGRCQGWRMLWIIAESGKLKKKKVRRNLVGVRSLEGLSTSGRLGLEGLLLFMYPNYIFQWIIDRLEGGGEVLRRGVRFPLR